MKLFKRILQKSSPSLYNLLASIRFFVKCKRAFGPCQRLVARTVFKNDSINILGGPFEGMNYYDKTIWGTITGKWLGCYEQEIQPVIDGIISTGYRTIVDVGAAEGYYAVGLARAMPHSAVISYDIDPIARLRQVQLAKLNNVSNLDVKKYCSHKDIAGLVPGDTVIICDIEGFEFSLIDPVACPNLKHLDILVECHNFKEIGVASVAEEIERRFSQTHEIERFLQKPREIESMKVRVPELKQLSDAEVAFALDEGRYLGQIWLWMKANKTKVDQL